MGAPIYESEEARSLTSLCRIHHDTTCVYFCQACGHLQTTPMEDVGGYYATDYDILVDSEEEDQIYEVRDGTTIYRTDHQVRVMLDKLPLPEGTRLLDYGCAKSSTIRSVCGLNRGVVPYAFDISARYVPFWEKFIEAGNWAIDEVPAGWFSRFDIVTSFFSLEHIPAINETMVQVSRLLRPGGTFYCVVPNVLCNSADFIVIDHCNHFTVPSLQRLFANAGLRIRDIDAQSHRGAFVVVADRPAGDAPVVMDAPATDIAHTHTESSRIAAYWRDASGRVRAFEASLADGEPVAIYGAGFYGAFISASLADAGRVACHLDQNPFLVGKEVNGRPVVHPEGLPSAVSTVMVGLNPAHAKAIIDNIPALSRADLAFFFL